MTATEHAVNIARAMALAASNKLGQDIVAMDVSRPLAITDIFLLVSASNERQVGAIVDAIDEAAAGMGLRVVRREGESEHRWVLLDLVDVVVHIMLKDERQLYSLERIWKDTPRIEVDLEPAGGAS